MATDLSVVSCPSPNMERHNKGWVVPWSRGLGVILKWGDGEGGQGPLCSEWSIEPWGIISGRLTPTTSWLATCSSPRAKSFLEEAKKNPTVKPKTHLLCVLREKRISCALFIGYGWLLTNKTRTDRHPNSIQSSIILTSTEDGKTPRWDSQSHQLCEAKKLN